MRGLAMLAGLAVLLTGCTGEPGLRVQATVTDEVDVIAVPALAIAAVNLDAGFATSPDQPAIGAARSATAANLGLGSFVGVAEIAVREGDPVTAGQQLARLDDRLLKAGLAAAESDAKVAAAQVGVLKAAVAEADDAAQEIADKQGEVKDALAELKEKRTEVKQAISELTKTRDKLKKQRTAVRDQRSQLITRRRQLQQTLDMLPPEAPDRPQLEAGIAQLTQGIAQLDAALKKMDTGLKQLDKGLKQARTGLSKLNTGIRKATDGLAELDEAAAEVRDAHAQLTRLQRLAKVAAETASVGVELAQAQLDQTVIVAPHDGTVIASAATGDHLAVGATLVTIRRDGPSRLRTWLSPDQVAGVCAGDRAAIHTDWGQESPAELTRIATTAEFPPTSQATDEVHLTRAFAVELTSQAALPAGAPVTVVLQPCRPNPTGAAEGEPHGNS
ncbi:MAG: biotin/lipoyl-binding protein [Propionicimonas sp.]